MIRTTFIAVALIVTVIAGSASAQVPEGPPPQPPRAATNVAYPAGYTEPWIEDSAFLYGPGLIDFNVAAFLAANAPHLVPRAEVISHWCGFYSISPQVLLAILEARSGVLSSPNAIDNPTAGLVPGANFDAQVQALLAELTEDFYAYRARPQADRDAQGMNAATFALVNAFRNDATIEAFAPAVGAARASFVGTFTRLFPNALAQRKYDVSIDAIPPTDLIQLPWAQGQAWYFNGVHTHTGSDPGVKNSIDFTKIWLPWSETSTSEAVVAAIAGTVSVLSTCQLRITSTSTGWSVNYYHLDQIQVADGQVVTPNQPVAVYANNQTQALCQGGSSTGPHVHFSLLFGGAFNALDGVTLGTYLVHPGEYSYDSRDEYMWLERNSTHYTAYDVAIQSYPTVTPTLVVNNVRLSEGDAGTKNATFTVSSSAAIGMDISFSYATSANANATAGSDFVTASGTTSIPAGNTSRLINVTVNGDTEVEPSETFALNLSAPSFGTITDSQGVATIINDDFTDPVLLGATAKVAHITELRTLINERRAMRGLAAYTFTDATLTAGSTMIKAVHVVEMRTALAEVYTNAGQAAPTYTDPTLTAESTTIKAVHLTELRDRAVNAP